MFTGEAKKKYQREYMRKRRSNTKDMGLTSNRSNISDGSNIKLPKEANITDGSNGRGLTPNVTSTVAPIIPQESLAWRACASTLKKTILIPGEESIIFRALKGTRT